MLKVKLPHSLLAAAILIAFPCASWAENHPADLSLKSARTFSLPNEEACFAKARSDNDADQCRLLVSNRLDVELNAAYKKALKVTQSDISGRQPKVFEEQLRKSQRAWLAYRAENCNLRGLIDGAPGSRWEASFAEVCRNEETEERIRFLNENFK